MSKSVRVRISRIHWDTDGENPRYLGLPKRVTHEFPLASLQEDASEAIGNWLSDTYGYCIFGFTYQTLKGDT